MYNTDHNFGLNFEKKNASRKQRKWSYNLCQIHVRSFFCLFVYSMHSLLFQCKLFWQNKGDYLCVKVDRYTKSKKVCVFVFIYLFFAMQAVHDESLLLPVLLLTLNAENWERTN